LAEKPARADLTSDATAIIEQLIEDDIAKQVIPRIACDIPLAENYFPGTVGAIETERFGGLPVILRKETSDLIGLSVLRLMDKSMVPDEGASGPAGVAAAPAAGTPAKAAGKTASPQVTLNVRQQTIFSNLTRKRGEAIKPVPLKTQPAVQPATASVAGASASTSAASSTQSTSQCPFFQNGKPVDPGLISMATQQMTACLSTQGNVDAELACSAALTVRDAADGDDQLLPNDLQRFGSAAIVAALSKAKPALAADKQWVDAATTLALDIAQRKSIDDDAKDFCGKLSAAPSTCQTDVKSVIQAVGSILASGLNASTLDQALAVVGQVVKDGCTLPPSQPPPALPPSAPFGSFCGSAAEKVILDAASDAIVIIGDIRTKDYGAAASAAIGDAQQLACDANSTSSECTDEAKKVFAFLEALAAYSVDSLVSGTTSAQTDTTFRQAAVALIEEAGGAGVHRSLSKYAAGLYVPEFSLREAWRPGHVGTSGSQVLAYPSIEMVRMRFSPYGSVGSHGMFYLNLHASLLDPLGPFVEVGTRDPSLGGGGSLNTGVFFLGFVVPRFDLEFGVPQLTKNLVIGAGGAVRAFRAEGSPGGAHYCTVFDTSACPTNKVLTGGNFEGSVFVKFVP